MALPELTQSELRKLHLGLNAQGDIVCSSDNFATSTVIAKACAVDPRFRKLLATSGFMYGVLEDGADTLETLVNLLEEDGQDNLAGPLMNLIAAMKVAKKRIFPLDQ